MGTATKMFKKERFGSWVRSPFSLERGYLTPADGHTNFLTRDTPRGFDIFGFN